MMRIFGAILKFLQEVRTELRKVNWPTRAETIRYTVFVIGFSAVVAALLGFLDFLYLAALRATVLQ